MMCPSGVPYYSHSLRDLVAVIGYNFISSIVDLL